MANKIKVTLTGQKDAWGNYIGKDAKGRDYKVDSNENVYETYETARSREKEEEEKRQREAKPGFFDDLPSLGSILERNLAEEKQKHAAIRAREKELFNSVVNSAVNVGGIMFTAAKIAGHADNKPEPQVRSDQEYMDMYNKLHGKRK